MMFCKTEGCYNLPIKRELCTIHLKQLLRDEVNKGYFKCNVCYEWFRDTLKTTELKNHNICVHCFNIYEFIKSIREESK